MAGISDEKNVFGCEKAIKAYYLYKQSHMIDLDG